MFINRFIAILMIKLCENVAGEIDWNGMNWAHGCEFNGNNLTNVESDGKNCGDLCVQNVDCTHFVWSDHNNGTCWMKRNGATKAEAFESSNPSAVCGVVKGERNIAWNGMNWAVGCDFNGNNLTTFPSVREDCRNICAYMTGCTHYTWSNYDKGTCWMKKNGATQIDAFYISDPLTECGVINIDYLAWNENGSAVGCDFNGNNLGSQIIEKEKCRELCVDTRSCTHYAWNNHLNGSCWMKKNGARSSDAIRKSDSTMLCGVITDLEHTFTWDSNNTAEGCDFTNNDIRNAPSSKAGCRGLCTATPECTHFAWNREDNGTCYLKNNVVTKFDAVRSTNETMCGIIIDLSSETGQNITWNDNYSAVGCDFNGNHLTSVPSSEELCRDLCRLITGCTHFSWTPTTNDQGICSMKKNGATKADAIRSLRRSTVCGIIRSDVHRESNFEVRTDSDRNQCDYCKKLCWKSFEASFTLGFAAGHRLAIQTRHTDRRSHIRPCSKSITELNINLILLFGTIPTTSLNQQQRNELNYDTSGSANAKSFHSLNGNLNVAVREPNFLIIYEDLKDIEFEVVSHIPEVDGERLVADNCSNLHNTEILQNFLNFANNQGNQHEWAHKVVHSIKYLDENITHLDLASNGLNELPELFDGLKNLEEIKLSKNELEGLTAGMFKHQAKLHSLLLDRNRLRHVASDAFQGLSSLRFLDLSCNNLGEIEANLFGNMNELIDLNLSHNKLTSISSAVFRGLHNLETLRINDNRLQTIHSKAFSHTPNLENVYAGTNQLAFVHTHSNLSLFQHLHKLNQLHLQRNRITAILPDWRKIPKLSFLSLGSNKITTLHYDDFNFTSSASVVVNLEDNHVRVINISDTIDAIKNVIVIIDRIDCCNVNVSSFMAYVVRSSSHIRFAFTNLSCSSADSTTLRNINDVKFRTMTCPLNECPSNCRCSKKPFFNALIFNCSYANLTHPPIIAYNGSYSQVELHIDHNDLSELPDVAHDLNIAVIQASHSLLTNIHPKNLPQNLRVLNVSHNRIQRLDELVFDELNNRRDSLQGIAFGNNPWLCDCSKEAEKLIAFVKQNEKLIKDLKEINCPDQRVDINGVNDRFIENVCLRRRNKIVFGVLGSVICFIAFFSILCVKYQQMIKIWLYAHNMCLCWVNEGDLDKDKTYDAFVAYSHFDGDFAVDTIVNQLENGTPRLKTCFHERDWLAGGFIVESIAQSIANSRRTVIILSKNFLSSKWGRTEFQYAHEAAIAEKRIRVIIVIYGDVGNIDDLDPDMQSYLRTNTYVKWGDKWFWEKLRYALGHRARTDVLSLNVY